MALDQAAEPMTALPGTCLKCRGTVMVWPGGGCSNGMAVMFDLIRPQGPGDVPMLLLHGCCYDDGPEDLDEDRDEDLDNWEGYPG
jgi:hypothetical protein